MLINIDVKVKNLIDLQESLENTLDEDTSLDCFFSLTDTFISFLYKIL